MDQLGRSHGMSPPRPSHPDHSPRRRDHPFSTWSVSSTCSASRP